MKALKRKWNSSRGASILLAMLFLLVCMMVGASVVMAASSNAGKIRSNREEQQKYLTLISALTLLCDELQSVEYVGRYTITKEDPVDTEIKKTEDSFYTITTYTYTQETGVLRQRTDSSPKISEDDWSGSVGNLNRVLPLYEAWDSIFAEQFITKSLNDDGTYVQNPDGTYVFSDKVSTSQSLTGDTIECRYTTATEPYFNSGSKEYELTFQVGEGNTSDGLKEPVTITVIGLNENGTIILRASLKDMVVRATLEPNGTKPNGLELLDTAKLKDIREDKYETVVGVDGKIHYTITIETDDHVTWELVAIEKVQEWEVLTDE